MNAGDLRRIIEEAYEETIVLRKQAEALGYEDIAEKISDALVDMENGLRRVEKACTLANSRSQTK